MNAGQVRPVIFVAGLLLVVVSLSQVYLTTTRGRDYQGEYAYADTDELAYSAYVNALVNGRPRRNDPYTGNDQSPFETLFSIQFLPAYAMAWPARALHLSASTVFIALVPLVCIPSLLILFTFLFDLTGRPVLSAIGAGGVLVFAGFFGQVPWDLFAPHLAFPFLRRYMPAFGFPFFLAIPACIWKALIRRSLVWIIAAGLNLIVLFYSYFFLWTAIVAWLLVLTIFWFAAMDSASRRWLARAVAALMAIAAGGLIPYLLLVAHRSPGLGKLLDVTHRPDVFRGPEVYAAVVMGLALLIHRRNILSSEKKLLCISLLVAPFFIYNQQLLTGRALQPFHYDQFVGNYWVLIAAVGLLGSAQQYSRATRRFVGGLLAVLALTYGHLAAYGRLPRNIEADRGRAVALKLADRGAVFVSDEHLTNSLATSSPNPVLWARYMWVFSATRENQKQRFYRYLYYANVDGEELRQRLARERSVERVEIFGGARANPVTTHAPTPITPADIQAEVNNYMQFCSTFGPMEATTPTLSYAVLFADEPAINLDRWYERDAGERVGPYMLYRLQLRTAQP
jgi:hypothetical protein